MNLDDRNLIEKWFLIKNLSSGTQKNYLISIREYSKLIGKSLSELLEDAEKEEDEGIRPRKRQVTHYLLKYKKYLEDIKIAPGTLSTYISAIKSFYKAFDITLPDIKLDTGDIGLEKNIGKPLSREDILKLISAANHRERALIYLMALSGMGQQEARDLTIKKLLNSASAATNIQINNLNDLFRYENKILQEILTLEITRKKVKYRHYTFLPPEATREIISYLKERCYGRNNKIRIKGNDDYIFVNNLGNQLSRDSIVTNFRRIGQQAGFKKDNGAYAFWRSHALRKYFISTIINKIGEKAIADYLAGHKISAQDRAYWQANPEDLKQHYLKALPHLSIDKAKVKSVKSEEYRQIKSALEEKDQELNKITNAFGKMVDLVLNEQKEENEQVREELLKAIQEINDLKK